MPEKMEVTLVEETQVAPLLLIKMGMAPGSNMALCPLEMGAALSRITLHSQMSQHLSTQL